MIRDIMHYFGLSVSDFAKIIHVKQSTVYMWLNEKKEPRIKKIQKLYSLVDKENWFPIFHGYIERPIGKFDKSLIEVLSEPDFNEEEVKNVVDEIRKMSIERTKRIDKSKSNISEETKNRILDENLLVIYGGV